jgi:hypothetical protein
MCFESRAAQRLIHGRNWFLQRLSNFAWNWHKHVSSFYDFVITIEFQEWTSAKRANDFKLYNPIVHSREKSWGGNKVLHRPWTLSPGPEVLLISVTSCRKFQRIHMHNGQVWLQWTGLEICARYRRDVRQRNRSLAPLSDSFVRRTCSVSLGDALVPHFPGL